MAPGSGARYAVPTIGEATLLPLSFITDFFFTSDVTAYHDLHHKNPQYPFRKCREIFKEKGFVNDKNIFSKTRSYIVYKYYTSLA